MKKKHTLNETEKQNVFDLDNEIVAEFTNMFWQKTSETNTIFGNQKFNFLFHKCHYSVPETTYQCYIEY